MGLQKDSYQPNINGFRLKVRLKYETPEKYTYTKNNKLDNFNKNGLYTIALYHLI